MTPPDRKWEAIPPIFIVKLVLFIVPSVKDSSIGALLLLVVASNIK